jgi:hypothetical protein
MLIRPLLRPATSAPG